MIDDFGPCLSPRRLIIMMDGTGNEVGRKLSNVLKLYRMIRKSDRQLVYYDPGVGTIGTPSTWRRGLQNAKKFFGLATGWGVDNNVIEAYSWLCKRWRERDEIWIIGFSRGAWAGRILGGLIHAIGILPPDQSNLGSYAYVTYKRISEWNDFEQASHFARVTGARPGTITFMGNWDAVGSVIVPRRDLPLPQFEILPFTKTNPSVRCFRHALAIDERRAMYSPRRWEPGQTFAPVTNDQPEHPQDAQEMWFAGVHSDVGGGYDEKESALSKYSLLWMAEQAKNAGLEISGSMLDHLAYGHERTGSSHHYVEASTSGEIHTSLKGAWWLVELLPKHRRVAKGHSRYYFKLGERRTIQLDEPIHWSVINRMNAIAGYRPENLKPKRLDFQ